MCAENRAIQLLNEHGVKSAPVNVVKLAKDLGYSVHKAVFKNKNISGGVKFLDGEKEKGAIYISINDSANRQRFTLAHELGHCIMHRERYREKGLLEGIDMFRNPENHSPTEVEANACAAEVLMPREMVRQKWAIWGSTEILADIFRVSLSAMSYRLFNLGLTKDW